MRLHNDCLIRVYQSSVEKFSIMRNISYYAGIMLNAFSVILCSNLCWHNRLVPICMPVYSFCYKIYLRLDYHSLVSVDMSML